MEPPPRLIRAISEENIVDEQKSDVRDVFENKTAEITDGEGVKLETQVTQVSEV